MKFEKEKHHFYLLIWSLQISRIPVVEDHLCQAETYCKTASGSADCLDHHAACSQLLVHSGASLLAEATAAFLQL